MWNGHHTVELDKSSWNLMAFITQYGCYRDMRVPGRPTPERQMTSQNMSRTSETIGTVLNVGFGLQKPSELLLVLDLLYRNHRNYIVAHFTCKYSKGFAIVPSLTHPFKIISNKLCS